MKFVHDDQFREERERFGLRFTCEDCVYFQELEARCVHGFDTRQHRSERYAETSPSLLFCKEFELV